jgi:hypothetical protein
LGHGSRPARTRSGNAVMSGPCSFRLRWVCFGLVAALLVAAVIGGCASTPPSNTKAEVGQEPEDKATTAPQLVDAIVNRNKPPKLVERRSGRPERVALFPEDYDWEEDKRVLKALDQLYQDKRVELWEELVRRTDDPSYCVTVVSVKNEDADLESVGRICGQLAYSHLLLFEGHLPLDPSKDGERLHLDVGIKNLADWRKERADKPLDQLQIEVCEEAVSRLSKVERVSEVEKASARKKIEAKIEKLRRTKQPDLVGYERFFVPFREYKYNPDLAKRVREVIKNVSSEHIDINK